MALKYIGAGKSIDGIPAQDLSDEEIKRHCQRYNLSPSQFEGLLIERGLYSFHAHAKETTKKKTEKEGE